MEKQVNENVADVIDALELYLAEDLKADEYDKSNLQHIVARLRRAHGEEIDFIKWLFAEAEGEKK